MKTDLLALEELKEYMSEFSTLNEELWDMFLDITSLHVIKKNECVYRFGDIPSSFFYIHQGLFRAYIINELGHEFNKNFFHEYRFFGPMSPLMFQEPINFEIEALEDGILIEIDNKKYRDLLMTNDALKLFHINYIEKRLEIAKRLLEESRMKDDAQTRYKKFKKMYPGLTKRLSQYHIASYLGITPTHLSRIRKKST